MINFVYRTVFVKYIRDVETLKAGETNFENTDANVFEV